MVGLGLTATVYFDLGAMGVVFGEQVVEILLDNYYWH